MLRRFTSENGVELERAQRFRAMVYLQRGYLDHEKVKADGRDHCPDDDRSVHVTIMSSREEIIGYVRVILERPDRPVPTLAPPFNVTLPGTPHGEISRLAIGRGRQGTRLVWPLWREAFWIAREHSLTYLYATMETPLLRVLTATGLPFQVIGDPRFVYNGENYPTRIRMADVIPAAAQVAPALAFFLSQPSSERFTLRDLDPPPEALEGFAADRIPSTSDENSVPGAGENK